MNRCDRLLLLFIVTIIMFSSCQINQTIYPSQTNTSTIIPKPEYFSTQASELKSNLQSINTPTTGQRALALTVIPTITITPTYLPFDSFKPSSVIQKSPAPPEKCPKLETSLQPDFKGLFIQTKPDMEQSVLDFLNSGGSQQTVIGAFQRQYPKSKDTFFSKDLTNDGVPDLVISEPFLYIFGCKGGSYQTILSVDPAILSNITPPPHYLYEGSSVVYASDMNLNGIPEIVVETWSNIINPNVRPGYQILEWDGSQFQNLIKQPDFRSRFFLGGGARNGWVGSDGVGDSSKGGKDWSIKDIDNNGTMELIITGGLPITEDNQMHGPWRVVTSIYMWNGQGYLLYQDGIAPPIYRFQAVQDADTAFLVKDYEKALELYQQVIFSDKLDWWSADRSQHEREVILSREGYPTPTPLPYNPTEHYYLSAYARFRILLLHIVLGHINEAEVVYQTILKKFPEGQTGNVFAVMATEFWSAYQKSKDSPSACDKAVEFASKNAYEVLSYLGNVTTEVDLNGKIYIDHGWQSLTYRSKDICPITKEKISK